jgi:hypothetical protein
VVTATKPTLRDVLLLVGLQIGIGAIAGALVAALPIHGGSGGWTAGLGVLVGSQAFVIHKEKKEPGRIVGPYAHWLALWAAVAQLVVGALFAIAATVAWPEAIEGLGLGAGMFVLIVAAIAGPLTYGFTRWGVRMGLKAAQRAKPRTRAP